MTGLYSEKSTSVLGGDECLAQLDDFVLAFNIGETAFGTVPLLCACEFSSSCCLYRLATLVSAAVNIVLTLSSGRLASVSV